MILDAFIAGIFIALFFYHILVFLGRKKDLSNLYYACICLIYCLSIIHHSLFEVNYYTRVVKENIFCVLLVCYGVTFVLFVDSIFMIGKKMRRFYTIYLSTAVCYTLICSIISITTSSIKILVIPYAFDAIFVIIFIFHIFFILYKKRKSITRKEKIVFMAFAVLVAYTLIVLTIKLLFFITPIIISHLVFLFMVLSFSYALTESFNKEHKDLIDLKNNLTEKVLERTQQLEQANKQKVDLFINLAHETKTPLTLIRYAMQDYVREHPPSPKLSMIQQNIDKLQRDVINFLDIQKLENNQIFYNHKQVTNVTAIIRNTIDFFHAYIRKKNLTLKADFTDDNVLLLIDPEAMARILNNLLENAVKYNKESGSITLTLTKDPDHIILKVADTGQGMPEDETPYLFTPYYQMSHKKRNTQGLGMGLSIIKKIMDDIAGKIEVATVLGEGTSFTLTFNNDNASADHPHTDIPEMLITEALPAYNESMICDSDYDKNLATIFIVEDNKSLLSYLTIKLKECYNVYYALNGKEALDKITRINKPDVIISDIMMDVMDGYTLKNKLNQHNEYSMIPFIFLTAKSSEKEKMKGLSMGAVDFILKPFSIEELLYKIQSITKIGNATSSKRLTAVSKQLINYLNKSQGIPQKITEPQNDMKTSSLSLHELLASHNITEKELKVASLLLEGLLYKEIGEEMGISINTVRTHIKKLYSKLKINSTKELIVLFKDYDLG